MKTPREILFEQHASADRELERIQTEVLRACLKTTGAGAVRDFGCGQGGEAGTSPQRAVTAEPTLATAKRPAEPAPVVFKQALSRMLRPAPQPREESARLLAIGFLSKLWMEVFMPARRTWAGFAFVWLVIITINASDTNHLPKQTSSEALSTTMVMAWKEQQQIVNELTGPTAMQSADRPKRTVPQPRSECRNTYLIG